MPKSFDIINTDIKLFTIKPDGTEAFELPNTHWDRNRIGEYKKLKLYFNTAPYSPQSIAGLTIYFTPALFLQTGAGNTFAGGKPTEYWSFTVDAGATPGTYLMVRNPLIVTPIELTNNYEVEIVISDTDDFQIHIKYFQLYDLNSFINSNLEQNRFKLLKDRAANASTLTVSGNSVYNNAAYTAQFYVYIQDDSNTLVNSNLQFQVNNYEAGFYAKNSHETAPYFTNETFSLSDGTNPVSTLMLGQDTQLEFTFDSLGFPDTVFLWLIRVDTNDNTVDFIQNYDASFIDCLTTVGTATIDNKFKSPSTGVTLVGGTTYKVNVWIDNTLLNFNETYRIIAIPYYTATLTEFNVNSFISDEYVVSQLPNFQGDGLTFTGSITDYLNEYFGNDLICIIEERLKSKLDVSYYYNGFAGDIFNRLGLTIANDIRRYLINVKVEVFETIGTTTQLFDTLTASKIDPVTYQQPTGLTLTFNDENLVIEYDFRVRYESWVTNLQTSISGVPLANPNDNQNWANRDLTIRFTLELFYDDYAVPFSDFITFDQVIHPKDYEPDVIEIMNEDNSAINDDTYYCLDEDSCLKAELTLPYDDEENYKLITTVEKSPGSITTIEEHETFTGELTQETTTKIISQEENYSETETNFGKFCLDNSEFFVNEVYKISAIAKKLTPPCTFASGQLTLDAPQDGDVVNVSDGVLVYQFLYDSGAGGWVDPDFNNIPDLITGLIDFIGDYYTITQDGDVITVTAKECGSQWNTTATNSPDREGFHWDAATEDAGTLTGGTP